MSAVINTVVHEGFILSVFADRRIESPSAVVTTCNRTINRRSTLLLLLYTGSRTAWTQAEGLTAPSLVSFQADGWPMMADDGR